MSGAKSLSVPIGTTDLDYIVFGRGNKPLILLPGLGDGLKTVKGAALTLASAYRQFAKDFRIYGFSRRNRLSACSIAEMAEDQALVMDTLGITNAHVMGVSQGGMIALHLAAAHPNLVDHLVLANTCAYANETVRRVVGHWMTLAEAGEYKRLFIDTAELSYSERLRKVYRPLYPLMAAASRPKSLERFQMQAAACLGHDARQVLHRITCPTLVMGGDDDHIVGPEAAQELASAIPGSSLAIYSGLGHAAYEEAKDFNNRVYAFLRGGAV